MKQEKTYDSAKVTYYTHKRDLSYGKSDLLTLAYRRSASAKPQKRPMYVAKEIYLYGKRGLFIRQKRPIYTAKVTYS